jgi:NADPH-dependent 2,4-dienoyl-CoA reductase/sulfur reductase-like enzyme/nitrite reductase/ring-hydroxylating ferredoxin subunit
VGAVSSAQGPDLAAGVDVSGYNDGATIAGRVGDEAVLASLIDGQWFAVSGTCTHYGARLGDGTIEGGNVRCPWHHACFDLRSGAVLRAPALDPLDRWKAAVEGGRLFVREKLAPAEPEDHGIQDVGNILIIGGGGAGLTCAKELRRLGHRGGITMLSADSDPPCDRPNLSKDYLAGNAPEEWIPLRQDDWYRDNKIGLKLNSEVQSIDTAKRSVTLASGERLAFDRLLIATGSEPRKLESEGFGGDNVLVLRTLADARALIDRAQRGARVAIIGSSFIGMEAAAAFIARGLDVTVISPEHVPFERVFGTEIGTFLKNTHEQKGVRFHLGTVAARCDERGVSLATGALVPADFVLIGIGVFPRTGLAEAAGLDVSNGVWVDQYLETSCPGIFAAGDIAAYPDPLTGERARIEHWTVALRQGATAAANMLGMKKPYSSAPFFWTEQHGVAIRYVGTARDFDEVRIDGEVGLKGCVVRYFRDGKHLASATINRDRENLDDELKLEREMRVQA